MDPEPEPALAAGTLLGSYRIEKLLGRGAMGELYAAVHTGLGKRVALKALHRHLAADRRLAGRFEREGRAAAAVHHPNVVEVTDVGRQQGIPYLVMEYLEGTDLATRFQRGPLPISELCDLLLPVIAGVGAAHDRGVVHRDLKPENIFLAREREGGIRPVVVDFGIAKVVEERVALTQTADLLGTPVYMAPEQLRGAKHVDTRCDQYALGVILYEGATGRLPVEGISLYDLVKRAVAGEYPALRDVVPAIPQAFEDVVLRAMKVDPAARFSSVHALGRALLPFASEAVRASFGPSLLRYAVEDDPTIDGAQTVAAKRTPAPRGPPWWILAVGAVLLGSAALAYVFVRGGGPAPEGREPGRTAPPSPSPPAPVVAPAPRLRFGVSRSWPLDVVERAHQGLADHLEGRTGRDVELQVMDDYLDLVAHVVDGRTEVASLSAAEYVRARSLAPGLHLLATHVPEDGAATYVGFIVTKRSSDITNLEALRGRAFCHPSRTSSSGYVYARALLRRAGLDPDRDIRPLFADGDHIRALHMLMNGDCSAAGIAAIHLGEVADYGLHREDFVILGSTERIPHAAYVAGPGVDAEVVEALRAALLELRPGSDLARRVLGTETDVRGFVPIEDSAYDGVRGVERYLTDPGP